jgi:hypothetical protein
MDSINGSEKEMICTQTKNFWFLPSLKGFGRTKERQKENSLVNKLKNSVMKWDLGNELTLQICSILLCYRLHINIDALFLLTGLQDL